RRHICSARRTSPLTAATFGATPTTSCSVRPLDASDGNRRWVSPGRRFQHVRRTDETLPARPHSFFQEGQLLE
ncbi:MAG: hypothetical protein OSB00_14255, partial [Sphingomonas bacterium]|nr:hypothetical protein [Sphingomonas bacterium]